MDPLSFIAQLLLAALLQSGAYAVVQTIAGSAVTVVDCAEQGAKAKAVEAARQTEKKSGKRVEVKCGNPVPATTSAAYSEAAPITTASGSDADAP